MKSPALRPLAAAISLLFSATLNAASFTVPSGGVCPQTDSSAKTLNADGEAGTVSAGCTLQVSGATAAVKTDSTGTVSIVNTGVISQTGTGYAIDASSKAGTLLLTNQAGASILATGKVAVYGKKAGASISIDNAGTLAAQAGVFRAIDVNADTAFSLINTGTIWAWGDDAIKASATSAGRTVSIDNQGTLWAKGVAPAGTSGKALYGLGQALDLNSMTGAAAGSIVNGGAGNTAAVIKADNDDAIRPGVNTAITNYGSIIGAGAVNTSGPKVDRNGVVYDCALCGSASDGIDAKANLGVTVDNHGSITGARHGITADNGITVTNRAGGQIIGYNGSGIGSDGTGTVTNYGTISGRYAGAGNVFDQSALDPNVASTVNNGDGDGVDVDGVSSIVNYGRIEGTGAGGVDSGGKANGADGIATGGGSIVNHAGAVIYGQGRGILVDDGANGTLATALTAGRGTDTTPGAAASISNAGSISGARKAAIALVGNFNDTLDNQAGGLIQSGADSVREDELNSVTAAAAIQMGGGNDVLSNAGTIIGDNALAIDLGAGDDTLNLNGGTITGSSVGGAGTDTLNFTAGFSTSHAITGFEISNVNAGAVRLLGAFDSATSVRIAAGASLETAASFDTGSLTVNGTLKTGSSPRSYTLGTLSVGTNGFLEASVLRSGTADQFNVIGAATVANGATLRPILSGEGFIADGAVFKIIRAGSLAATPAAVNLDVLNNTSPLLSFSLRQTGSDLELVAARAAGYAGFANAVADQASGAAAALEALGGGAQGNLTQLINQLEALPDAASLRSALQSLAPSQPATGPLAASSAVAGATLGVLGNRLNVARGDAGPLMAAAWGPEAGKPYLRLAAAGPLNGLVEPQPERRFWVQALATRANQSERDNVPGYRADVGGFLLGADRELGVGLLAGFSAGVAQAQVDGRDSGSGDHTEVTSYQLAAYASRDRGQDYLDGMATLAFNRYQSDRLVAFAGAQPHGEHNGQQFDLRGEYGRRHALGENLNGRLLGSLQYAWLHEGGYSESGSTGAELVVAERDTWTLRSSLGGQLDWGDRAGRRNFHLRAVWLHDFNDEAPSLSASFGGQGSAFTTYGARPERDGLGIGLGMRYTTAAGTRLKLGYEGEFRSGYQGHSLTAQAGWAF